MMDQDKNTPNDTGKNIIKGIAIGAAAVGAGIAAAGVIRKRKEEMKLEETEPKASKDEVAKVDAMLDKTKEKAANMVDKAEDVALDAGNKAKKELKKF